MSVTRYLIGFDLLVSLPVFIAATLAAFHNPFPNEKLWLLVIALLAFALMIPGWYWFRNSSVPRRLAHVLAIPYLCSFLMVLWVAAYGFSHSPWWWAPVSLLGLAVVARSTFMAYFPP